MPRTAAKLPAPTAIPADASADGDVIARLRAACVRWYRHQRRDLPWRRNRDPYTIWVAEILLQQTRADVVAPRFERFVARFPDVATLAAAPVQDVLSEWAGLGYYARARNLHAAARLVMRDHGGCVPRQALLQLPGIGRYTAGAIRSIAWDDPEPILDGNVARVFARVFGVDGESAAVRQRQWELAAEWARGADPGDANQALMELGATVCTKPQPACTRCPLEDACFARRHGRELELPAARRRPPVRRLALTTVVVADGDRILLVRRSHGRLLRDWWELPALAVDAEACGVDAVDAVAARAGVTLEPARALACVRHAILQHAIEARVYAATVQERGSRPAARAGTVPAPASPPPPRPPPTHDRPTTHHPPPPRRSLALPDRVSRPAG